nr:hypothetical protein [Tanacetum cinerariifolium]
SGRIVPLFDTMLVHQGDGSGTPTEPHHTSTPEADTSHPTTSSVPLPSLSTAPIPLVTQTNTTPIRQYSRRARIAQSSTLLTAQEEEILRLKERVQVLKDRDSVAAKHSGDDAPIKGRSVNEGEASAKRISNDSEEIARVLTSMDTATVLAGGIDRRPVTKKQKRKYYMAMIKNNLGWKVKDFKGLSFEKIKAKFAEVWKQVEDFIPTGSKEEAERLKRKG